MIEQILKIPLLSSIDASKLQWHIGNNSIRMSSYAKGVTVYNQKDICKTLDVVMSGSLVAYSLSENGSATTMFEFQKGSILGANLLFGNNHAYPLNIYCLTNAKLLHISKDTVADFLHDYEFTVKFISSLSLNSQGMNQKIAMFTQNTLRQNILEYLRNQAVLQNSNVISLPLSKKELADYFGVQRPSLFRELKRLKDEGVIEIKNRDVILRI